MKTRLCILVIGLLLSFSESQRTLTQDDLKEMSQVGEKYVDEQIENAINGVKQMKTLMEKTGKEHKMFLQELEETKMKKEEALKVAKEAEIKLNDTQEVCNETMLALWEECKPCLKTTCIRFYSKTCRSGSALVGRQLEEYLNRTSPFSIWVNGERIDSLLEEGEQQGKRLEDLEERYTVVEDGVDDIFQGGMSVFGHMQPFFARPFMGGLGEFPRMPSIFPDFHFPPKSLRISRAISPETRLHFHGAFQPLFEMAKRMFDRFKMQFLKKKKCFGPYKGTIAPAPNDQMLCREIRRNSAGCLKLSEKCEKCQEILSVDCSGKRPPQGPLKEQFEDALRIAEKFTNKYDELLKKFQENMFNTTSMLDQLNKQFGWVSKLANITGRPDEMFQVTTVFSRSESSEDSSKPADTSVSVQLFDSPPMTFTVPGDIPWDDPKFMEIVAQEALDHYKQSVVKR
uniref:Clusterin n=1 Tax=Latimeria chalumnae TaxID=7897 RepID=H3AKI2_LATCH